MEKKYIQVFLNQKNIKKEREFETNNGKTRKKVCVSFPKLGLCWLLKQQTVVYNPTKKDGTKSEKKQLMITLSADAEYEFYNSKTKEAVVKTGQEIRDYYKNLWEDSKNLEANEDKVFVSTQEFVKELKNDKVSAKDLEQNTQQEEQNIENKTLSQEN